MTYIQTELSRKYNPQTECWDDVEYSPCPFGVRKLEHGEERCYYGNGKNRCKYFVRYDWEEHYGCIACKCDLPRKDQSGQRYEIDEHGNEQYCFDFGEGFN